MDAVSRQAGNGWVISRTYVVAEEGKTGMSGSVEVPDFNTFPGRYMAELPPSTGVGSTIDHVWVATLRTRVTMASSAVAAARTRPSGRTNM